MKINTKAFTLIELLAVIVILAIIALIATPIVLNIIASTKESSQLRSAEMYLDAVEQAVMREKLDNTSFKPNTCIVLEGGNLECDGDKENVVTVEVEGEAPEKDSIITFTNGKIDEVSLTYSNNKTVVKNNEGNLGYITHKNGKVVYFNVSKGVGCTEKEYKNSYDETTGDYLNSKTGYNGITTTSELQNSCLKFYAFNDNSGDTISLLLDHNTTAYLSPNNDSNDATSYGAPLLILDALKSDTSSWKGTITQNNYIFNHISGKSYTIDYSEYKARLITANEIAKITGNKTFDESTVTYANEFYFDTNTGTESSTCTSDNISGCNYGWLYDRTEKCINYGCSNNDTTLGLSGYYTSTIAFCYNNSLCYWAVGNASSPGNKSKLTTTGSAIIMGYGVRPVIEVKKSSL